MSEFFEIDLDNLEKEWGKQPRLYHEHALHAADCRRKHAEAKAELELTEAELDREIRQNPMKFGIDKLTEKTVESCTVSSQRYQKALLNAIKAKHDLDVAEVAVETLNHKKYGLQDEVRLRLSDYFSEPKVKDSEGGNHLRNHKAEMAFNRKGKK